MLDRLKVFLGKSIDFIESTKIHSPKIDEISELGESIYNVYLALATFDKETIMNTFFKLSHEEMNEVREMDDYAFLVATPLLNDIISALSFFTKSDITFDGKAFYSNESFFLDNGNYMEFRKLLNELNGVREEPKLKFKNKIAEEKYYQMKALEKKYAKDDGLYLKDMCSILCNAEGNGINVFNIGNLTLYQVYEHFERLQVKEMHRRILKVWASGNLPKEAKLEDWMIKTKL